MKLQISTTQSGLWWLWTRGPRKKSSREGNQIYYSQRVKPYNSRPIVQYETVDIHHAEWPMVALDEGAEKRIAELVSQHQLYSQHEVSRPQFPTAEEIYIEDYSRRKATYANE